MATEAPSLDDIDAQARALAARIVARVKELGDVDVMTIRRDPEINELLARVCRVYAEGGAECAARGSPERQVCDLFRDEPDVVRWLELSEENICRFLPH